MARVLVTGATGWVGSIVVPELLARGHTVTALVRGAGVEGAASLRGDVARSGAGVEPHDLARARGQIDAVLHLAAAIRLDSGDTAGELQQVNVEGTRHVLGLAEQLGARDFLLMSTCAVGGDAPELSETQLDSGQRFRNGYERTKLEAERLAGGWPGRGVILRMPGLVGDSRTGATRSFAGAFYRVAAAYWVLRAELLEAWAGSARAALQGEGIRLRGDGKLELPVHVPFSASSRCEVVTEDWLAAAVVDVLEARSATGTLHLVHPDPPLTPWALTTSLEVLGFAAPHPGSGEVKGPWTRLVRRTLDRFASDQYPYLMHTPRLRDERFRAALGARYRPPPPIDRALIERLLDHAVQRQFGT